MTHSTRESMPFELSLVYDDEGLRVWHGRTDLPSIEFVGLLSPEERTRAGAFGNELLRRRFIVRRGTLRRLLGEVLGQDPHAIAFLYGRRGKPALVGDGPEFNLSYRDDDFLVAVGLQDEVGVDIEKIDISLPLHPDHLRDNFSTLEQRLIGGDPELFWRAWVRKEACIKALGVGLFAPLPAFEVLGEDSKNPSRDLRFRDGLRVSDVTLPEGLIGAVAIRSKPGH